MLSHYARRLSAGWSSMQSEHNARTRQCPLMQAARSTPRTGYRSKHSSHGISFKFLPTSSEPASGDTGGETPPYDLD